MSVAEALGGDVRVPNVDPRKSKYFSGLRLGDLSSHELDGERNTSGKVGSYRPDKRSSYLQASNKPVINPWQLSVDTRGEQQHVLSSGMQSSWTDRDRDRFDGDGKPTKRSESDLFLNTLGGPGGTVLRQNGSPPLTDPHFTRQQQQLQSYPSSTSSRAVIPMDTQEYNGKLSLDHGSEETKVLQQIDDLMKQIDQYKSSGQTRNNSSKLSSLDAHNTSNTSERRSLDLESTRGGAGAPFKDALGRKVTRLPITLSRDDYGESKIKEDIPGKATFDLDFTNKDSKPYYPWGGHGGGAPIRNRDGSVVTHVYGKLESLNDLDGEVRRNKRRQEVLYNELKECARQQKENKDELTRYMKAPQVEMADLLLAGRVGKPRRDHITGEITPQHLPNSDISKYKMNYQPVPMLEKKKYHDELVRMAEERQHQKQLEKLKEKQESNAHFQNMDSTWGAFGGGAPKHQVIRKKANLTNSLFFPHQSRGVSSFGYNEYMPPTGLGSFEYPQVSNASELRTYREDVSDTRQSLTLTSPRDLRLTGRSSHKNLFDIPVEHNFGRSGSNSFAPYATSGMY